MTSSFLRISLISIVLLIIFVLPVFSQDSSNVHHVGFSVSLQDNQFDILVPIWIGSKATIAPAFGLTWIQGTGTDLHVGLVPKIYLSRNKVSPFASFRVAVLKAMPSIGEGTTDWLLGFSIGGEYFFDENFSIGIESQLNYTISDERSARFGNPGKSNLNTAAAIFASIYF